MYISSEETASRIIKLYQYICTHASPVCAVKMSAIQEYLKSEDLQYNWRTVKKDLDALYDCGIELEYSPKAKGYYYTNPLFEPYEISLIIEAIQAMKFITKEKADDLTRKLKALTDTKSQLTLNKHSIVADRVRNMNNAVMKDLEKIHYAKNNGLQISFKYAHFSPDKSKPKKYVKMGNALTVSPYAVYWNNGNCYLYAYISGEDKFRFFRIDRMENIQALSADIDGKQMYSEKELTSRKVKIFNMYRGREEYDVKIRFINRLADQVIDEFGKDVMMIPVDEEHFVVTVRVSVSPTFYAWIATFGHSVKILFPPKAVEGMKKFIQDADDMYKDDGEM